MKQVIKKKITTVRSVEKVGETAVYSKRGNDIINSTTVRIKDSDIGQITKTKKNEIFKQKAPKMKLESVKVMFQTVEYQKRKY
ncbi:hypothetical protein [Streptococcus infantis]|uniref:hypothetical protein n=1 Tax=Streptococcus infantis TaxID=68892 RepID=UPI0039C2ADC6